MILRIIIILIVFSLVIFLLRRMARLSLQVHGTLKEVREIKNKLGQKPSPTGTDMVRCLACGSFVSAHEAVTLFAQGRSQSFCSHECIKAHVKNV